MKLHYQKTEPQIIFLYTVIEETVTIYKRCVIMIVSLHQSYVTHSPLPEVYLTYTTYQVKLTSEMVHHIQLR